MTAVSQAVLITGSGSGIGAAIARRFAKPDVGVLLHARSNRAGCEVVAETLAAGGARCVIVLGDLALPETAAALAEAALDTFGRLDVLVANAGFPVTKPFSELDRGEVDRAFAVIAGGFFELARQASPALARSPAGRVIAISTLNVHLFRNDFPVYPASGAAKAALETLVRGLAMELAPSKVTVNAVAPGLIVKDSDREQHYDDAERRALLAKIPLGRMGTPDEVAALVAFLASEEAAYITGQTLHVSGGIL